MDQSFKSYPRGDVQSTVIGLPDRSSFTEVSARWLDLYYFHRNEIDTDRRARDSIQHGRRNIARWTTMGAHVRRATGQNSFQTLHVECLVPVSICGTYGTPSFPIAAAPEICQLNIPERLTLLNAERERLSYFTFGSGTLGRPAAFGKEPIRLQILILLQTSRKIS